MKAITDALTHSDAFSLYNPYTHTHTRTHRKPLYMDVRQGASVRQASP